MVELENPNVSIPAVHASVGHGSEDELLKSSNTDSVVASHICSMTHGVFSIVLLLTITAIRMKSISRPV